MIERYFSADQLRWRAVCMSTMKMHLRSPFTMILVVVQCHQIDLLQCTTQNQPHQSRMLSVRVYQTLMELCVECLLHNPLVWGYIARTSGKLYIGEYHEHLNNTSRNADVLAGITYQQRQCCCILQHNYMISFVQKLLLTIVPTRCATVECY